MLALSRAVQCRVRPALAELPICPFDRVFVINLDSRPERWSFVANQLRAASIPLDRITRFPAVVGAQLDPHRLHDAGFVSRLGLLRLQERASHRVWGMDLNLGAMGCALSHIQIWARIAAQRFERVLVLEDDSVIPVDFLNQYRDRMGQLTSAASQSLASSWDLVYVGGLDTERVCSKVAVAPGVSLVPRMHRTTNAYVTHYAGVEALLRLCVPLTYQLDTQMTLRCVLHPETAVPFVVAPRCLTMQPPLIVQTTSFPSDIQAPTTPSTAAETA